MDIISMPFAWIMRFLYNLVGNFGVAVILFALIVRLIMLPFQMKSKRSTMRTSRLAPMLKELEKKYSGNQQKYQEEVSRIYKEEKINPMSGCLWSLIPFPILIALYGVIRQPLSQLMRLPADVVSSIASKLGVEQTGTYWEISAANLMSERFSEIQSMVPVEYQSSLIDLDYSFLGLNLGEVPSWKFWTFEWSNPEALLPALGLFLIPILSGLFAFLQSYLSTKMNPSSGADQMQGSMKSMMYMMPLVSVYIAFIMPAALGVYWTIGSVLALLQDIWLTKRYTKVMELEDADRQERFRQRESELEKKREETERLRALGETAQNRNTSKKRRQALEKQKGDERRAAVNAARREEDKPASQSGNRRYARGRAYVSDRYENPEFAEEATLAAAEESECGESIDPDIEEEIFLTEVSEGMPDDAGSEGYNDDDSDNDFSNDELSDDAESDEDRTSDDDEDQETDL